MRLALGFTARIDGHNALALLLPLHQHGTTVGSSDNLSQLGQSSIALCFHESILNTLLVNRQRGAFPIDQVPRARGVKALQGGRETLPPSSGAFARAL